MVHIDKTQVFLISILSGCRVYPADQHSIDLDKKIGLVLVPLMDEHFWIVFFLLILLHELLYVADIPAVPSEPAFAILSCKSIIMICSFRPVTGSIIPTSYNSPISLNSWYKCFFWFSWPSLPSAKTRSKTCHAFWVISSNCKLINDTVSLP